LLCLDLVHANAMQRELSKRLAYAQEMAAAIEAKFERGEANILELNKVKLNLLNIQKEAEGIVIERSALLADLSRLNGGQAVDLPDSTFPVARIAEEFEGWYSHTEKNNPQLQWLKKEILRLDAQVKLDRSLSLPKLAIGYMSETVDGERYQGVTAGLSIPLFERKNAIRYDKARAGAMRLVESDARVQFYNQMKALHARVVALQKSAQDYRLRLPGLDNTPLLKKALDNGEISLIEFVLELSMYYDSSMRLLQIERDLGKALAVLNQYGSNDVFYQ
jgi:outer membrane protein TolC